MVTAPETVTLMVATNSGSPGPVSRTLASAALPIV
jgi:hypothetical protein